MSARLSQFYVYGGRVFVYTIYIYEVLDSIPLWDIVTQRERLWQRVSLSVIECHRNSLWRGVMGEWLWWMQGQFNCFSSNVLNRKLIIWSLTSEKVDAAILDCKRQELLTKLNTSWFHNWIEKGKNYHISEPPSLYWILPIDVAAICFAAYHNRWGTNERSGYQACGKQQSKGVKHWRPL